MNTDYVTEHSPLTVERSDLERCVPPSLSYLFKMPPPAQPTLSKGKTTYGKGQAQILMPCNCPAYKECKPLIILLPVIGNLIGFVQVPVGHMKQSKALQGH